MGQLAGLTTPCMGYSLGGRKWTFPLSVFSCNFQIPGSDIDSYLRFPCRNPFTHLFFYITIPNDLIKPHSDSLSQH